MMQRRSVLVVQNISAARWTVDVRFHISNCVTELAVQPTIAAGNCFRKAE